MIGMWSFILGFICLMTEMDDDNGPISVLTFHNGKFFIRNEGLRYMGEDYTFFLIQFSGLYRMVPFSKIDEKISEVLKSYVNALSNPWVEIERWVESVV